MSGDLLQFQRDEPDLALEPELSLEPPTTVMADLALEPELPAESIAPVTLLSTALVEILPAGFPLPRLVKFVPNAALRVAINEAAAYALSIPVEGTEGLQRADLALAALRRTIAAVTEHFQEPAQLANDLHKSITGTRGEWTADGAAAVTTIGGRMVTEQRRLDQIAAEERRRAQDEANRLTREAAAREVEAAEKHQAPAVVVEELRRQAETATAPPVAVSAPAPMRSSTITTTWKARLAGTPADADPNPGIEMLTNAQRGMLFGLLKAIVNGQAPLAAIEINWSYLNKRAKADKSTLTLASIEAFEESSVRAKGTRR